MYLLLVSAIFLHGHVVSKPSLLLFVCLFVWQVGSDFGYFPKDLLEINHNYSNEELELPTDVSLTCSVFFFSWGFTASYLGIQ